MNSVIGLKIHKGYLVFILATFLVAPLVYLIYSYSIIYIQVQALLKREQELTVPQTVPVLRTQSIALMTETDTTGISSSRNSIRYSINSILNTQSPGQKRSSTISDMSYQVKDARKFSKKVKTKTAAKVTTVFAAVTVTYVITWFPVIYMTLLEVIERKDLEPKALKLISAFMIGVNSVTDPLIYGLCLKDVRKQILALAQQLVVKKKF